MLQKIFIYIIATVTNMIHGYSFLLNQPQFDE